MVSERTRQMWTSDWAPDLQVSTTSTRLGFIIAIWSLQTASWTRICKEVVLGFLGCMIIYDLVRSEAPFSGHKSIKKNDQSPVAGPIQDAQARLPTA